MKPTLPFLTTLGNFEISESGRALRIPRAKEKALIAFLAVNAGHAFQRYYLANLLWQNASEENSKHSLNNALYTINRAIPNLFLVRGTSIEVDPRSISTDLQEVTRLIEDESLLSHLSIIRGEFLADLNMRDAPEFESWRSDYNRELFFTIAKTARKELGALDTNSRHAAKLRLASLTAISPIFEFPDDLGDLVGMTEDQRESHIEDRTRTFSLPFVGRDRHLAYLRRLWEESCMGSAMLINVTGHPGHGKTRLMDEFISSMADQRVKVLRARCYQSERRIAFGPILEMFDRCLTAEDLGNIEPIWLAALRELMPSLPGTHATAPPLSAVASQSRFYEAVARAMASMADRTPLFIFIDDVQWADESTQALLSFLAHRLKGSMMLVVAERSNSRDANPTPPWRSWPSVSVEELSEPQLADAVRLLPKRVSSVVPPIAELDRLTRGHPYMVTELIRSATHGAPSESEISITATFSGVDAFLGSLLSELPANAQRIASAMAVIGRPAPISLVAKVSRANDVTAALVLLMEKGLVDHVKGKVSLRHDLLRGSIYRRLPIFTRNELHRGAAAVLGANPRYLGETAEHYYKARDRKYALKYALQAAREADSRYAHEESIYFLRMALKAGKHERNDIRLLLAERLYRANRTRQASQEIKQILAKRELLNARDVIVWKLRELELAYDSGMIPGPTMRVELEHLKATIPDDATPLLSRLLFLQCQSAFHDGSQTTAKAAQYALKALAGNVGSADEIAALANGVHGHTTITSASEADEWAAPLRTNLNTIIDAELKVRVLLALTSVAYSNGRLSEASECIEKALEEILRAGVMNMWGDNAAHAHMLYVEQGRFIEASGMYKDIKSRAVGQLNVLATASANAALMHYSKGEYAEAKDAATFGLAQLESRQSTWADLVLRGLSGISSLELGDFTTAAAAADYATKRIDALGTRMVDLSYVEILIARVATLKGHRQAAMTRLRTAIHDYLDRDIICRLRLQLELARMLKTENRAEAKSLAKQVYETARTCNAVIIADAADSLLARL